MKSNEKRGSIHMEKIHKTQGIVLRKKSWKEDDLLFSIFTRDFGKVDLVATGSRKIQSKLVGHLSSFGFVEILFMRARHYNKLTNAYLTRSFPVDSSNHYSQLLFEIIDKSFTNEDPSQPVYYFLEWTLEKMGQTENDHEKKFLLNIFIIKVLDILGFGIALDQVQLNGALKTIIKKIQAREPIPELSVLVKDNDNLFFFLRNYLQSSIEKKINGFDWLS